MNTAWFRHLVHRLEHGIWWPTLAGVLIFMSLFAVGWGTSPSDSIPDDDWRVMLMLGVGIPACLGGHVWTLLLRSREMRRRHIEVIAECFLQDRKLVAYELCIYCLNYRGGWLYRSIGGMLTLTDESISFRSNPGDLIRDYRLEIPLLDVTGAEPCKVAFYSAGLRVTRQDGTAAVFLLQAYGGARRAAGLIELINGHTDEFGS